MNDIKTEYPECDKMVAIRDKAQAIGDFLDNGDFTLCQWHDELERYLPIGKSMEQLLADAFDIDLIKVEAERRQMLASMQ